MPCNKSYVSLSLSLCKQSERREDKVQRGNPLFKCQAVRAILSLPLSFPLFGTSQGSDSRRPSLPSDASCVFGHVGVTVHVPACASLSPRRWSCVLGRRHESTSVSRASRAKPGRRSTSAGCLLLSKEAVWSLRRKRWRTMYKTFHISSKQIYTFSLLGFLSADEHCFVSFMSVCYVKEKPNFHFPK